MITIQRVREIEGMTKGQNDRKTDNLFMKMNDIINGDLKMNEQILPPTLSISDVQTSNKYRITDAYGK